MDMLWRLLTAIFMIAAAVGMIAIGWLFSGGMFQDTISVLMAYAAMFLILVGIGKGILVIMEHNRKHKEQE